MADMLLETKKIIQEDSTWSRLKEEMVSDISSETVKNNTLAILESSRGELMQRLNEAATLGSTAAGNIAMLPKVILPVIRRVATSVIANEIMGVQPMAGPLGYVYTLRSKYAENVGGATGVNAGAEAMNPSYIASFYSGNENPANPAGDLTANKEGTGGRRMSIDLVKQAVEAKSRKLQAEWTFEAAQDAQSQLGLDIEQELMALLAQEITADIDQEMLHKLRSIPSVMLDTYDQNQVSGTATFVGDEHAALATLINYGSNVIAQRTRRGAGNWVVLSHAALTVLTSAKTSALARTTEGNFDAPTNVKFVGTLNSTVRVFVDTYADAGTDVLVGYKGSETDAAAFYCPYIPLMSTPVIMDPTTFTPRVSFMSRYGYAEMTNTATSLGNSADYLARIAVNATNLRFK